MRHRWRRLVGVVAVCTLAVLSRQVNALPEYESDDYYYDSNGGLQGIHMRGCDNSIYTDGILAGTLERESIPCDGTSGQCDVFCWTDCSGCDENNTETCCATGPVSCEDSQPGSCGSYPGCLCS